MTVASAEGCLYHFLRVDEDLVVAAPNVNFGEALSFFEAVEQLVYLWREVAVFYG